MKKITFLISSLAGGGAEGVCVSVANGLADKGWEVDLVVLHLKRAVYRDRVSKNVNLVNLDVHKARYASLSLLKYLRHKKPKKIIAFNYELAVILVFIRSVFRFSFSLIARNINTRSENKINAKGFWLKVIVNPLIDRLYCKVDHVINQCEAMRNDLIRTYPELREKCSVIYNPVAKNIEEYTSESASSSLENEVYFLCVGRLEKQKSFHYAIEAFSKISEKFPFVRLKIVGDGSEKENLKKVAAVNNVFDKVDFEGFKSDVIPYYINAKATLLTSLYEGFPNVLIESITLGTPVISFDCPSGPREIIVESVNGSLVPDKDVVSFSHSLESIIVNKPSFSKSAVMKTSFKYSLARVSGLYAELLKKI